MPNVRIRREFESLSGPEKVAIMLLTLGEDRAAPLLERMEESEVRMISRSMASLGSITADLLEELITRFTDAFSKGGSIIGSADTAERMLKSFLPSEKVSDIMTYIRGPNASSTWEKMSMVNDSLLGKYLQGEHPQTIAVVMSKVAPEQAANVLANLPEDEQSEIVRRMMSIQSVPEDVLRDIEEMLQRDLMLNYTVSNEPNNYEHLAEIFNRVDTERCEILFNDLRDTYGEEILHIKELMFTFDDLMRLDAHALKLVVRGCDNDTLTYAMKGCTEEQRNLISAHLSERALGILLDNMETMGPVPMRDVDAAKNTMIRKAKELAEKHTIMLGRGADAQAQLVY